MYYLGQHKDPERARRYEAIGDFLGDYSYLNPKVPEIDAIVPLPPAKLPPWDTFKWLRTTKPTFLRPCPQRSASAKCAAKNLDPETGRPLP